MTKEKKTGYFKNFRKSLFNKFLNPKGVPYDYYHAWFYLVSQAEYEKKENCMFEIGQLEISIRKLSEKWNWTKSKVETFLKNAEEEGMILLKSDTSGSVITIVKFSDYNTRKSDESDTDTLSDTKSDTKSDTESDTISDTSDTNFTDTEENEPTPNQTPNRTAHRTPNRTQIRHLPIKERRRRRIKEAAAPQNFSNSPRGDTWE